MKWLAVACLVLALVPAIVLSLPWDDGRSDFEDSEPYEREDSNALQMFSNLKKRGGTYSVSRRDWCARWGDYCVPNAKVSFAQCCDNLRCLCGKFWTQGKCVCKSASTFGR